MILDNIRYGSESLAFSALYDTGCEYWWTMDEQAVTGTMDVTMPIHLDD